MNKNNKLNYTCIFGGGAIRGAAHIGALKALEELGIVSDTFGGSSVGAIFAVLYAIGYKPQELEDIFLKVNFELFKDISFGLSNQFAISKGEVFLDWFRELLEKKFYKNDYKKGKNPPIKFKDIDKNIIIFATNMLDFTSYEFSSFETPDYEVAMAVRISCCAPGLMRAVELENKLLVDGDLMKGRPMWSLSKNLKCPQNRILEIRLEGEYSTENNKPIDYINGIYSCITSCGTDFIQLIYKDCDMYDLLVLNTGNVVVFDFNYPIAKRQAIIDSGYEQTLKYFKNNLSLKKQKLYSIYTKIMDKLRNVQTALLRKKYLLAKNYVAELYITLTFAKDLIDENIFNEINKFQKILFSNVKSGLLNISICTNIDLVRTELNLVINMLNDKINDFEKYFSHYHL